MEQPEVPLNTVDYGSGSNPPSLAQIELANEIRECLHSQALWQTPHRRRSSSCHSHYDSSSTSSKYNSDSDSSPPTGTNSSATSWSSHCDDACDHHETSSSKQNPAKTEQHTTNLREAITTSDDEKPHKLSINTQNLPPWDAWFPEWHQCESPGPIRQLSDVWSAINNSNMQGLWAPPPPPPAAGGLWGM